MRYPVVAAMVMAALTVCAQGSGFSFNYSGPTQIIVGPSCEAPLNWGHPNTPTATSNLPGGIIVSFTIYSISGGYQINDLVPGGTTVMVFYQALDNFGNTALFGFTIAFVDQIPPVFDPFSLPPANITVNCSNNLPTPPVVEVSDNCDNENTNLTITYTQTGSVAPCAGGTITRRWVANDGLGNLSTFTQTITVTPDVTPPVIANNLQNGMAPCSTAMTAYSAWLTTQRANFTATDVGCGLMSLSDNAPSPAIITSFCGNIDVTFSARDNCNNTSTVVRTFTVTNSVPPVITTPASNASGNCSQPNIQGIFNNWINTHGGASATDDCSSIFWSTYPANPSLADTCNAAIQVLFIAGDGCNNFDTTAASFLVTDNTGPSITQQASTRLLGCTTPNLDSVLVDWLTTAGQSTASDLCTPAGQLIVNYTINGIALNFDEVLAAWADSLAAGCRDNVIINGIGINNVKGYIPVTFNWTDKCGNATGTTGSFGITDNGRPAFAIPPQDTGFTCVQGLDWEPFFMSWYNTAGFSTVSDACSEVVITASITADSALQYLAAALDTACNQGVAITLSFTATDECGNSSTSSPSATFTLSDTLPPVLLTQAVDLLIGCTGDPQQQLEHWLDTLGGASASDGCGELTWTFSWTETGETMSGAPGSGPYPQIGMSGCNTSLAIIFRAEDPCMNAMTDTASLFRIDTTGPTIVLIADTVFLACTEPVPGDEPVVTDDCDMMPVVSYSDLMSPDTCTGMPAWTLRTWLATDACGNSTTATILFITTDTTAPTFDLPVILPSGCEPDSLMLTHVLDNCDAAPIVTWEDIFSGDVCSQTLTRTWIVTDACGNARSAVQVIPLNDDTPPVIVQSPGDAVFTCDPSTPDLQVAYDAWRTGVVIEDGCSAAAYFLAISGSFDPGDTMTWPGIPLPDALMAQCGEEVVVEGQLVAYDECGNIRVAAISFTISDMAAPVFDQCPDRVEFAADDTCMGLVSIPFPPVTEICNPDSLVLQYSLAGGDTIGVTAGFSLDTVLTAGLYPILWLATDCHGLTSTCTTILAVISEDAITLDCPADTSLFTGQANCSLIVQVTPPSIAYGDCGQGAAMLGGYIEGSASPATFSFNDINDVIDVTFSAGMYVVYLVGEDITGDIDTCKYIVTVSDTISPTISCQPDTVRVLPSGPDTIYLSPSNVPVSFADACGTNEPVFIPAFITCDLQGQDITVSITVTDPSGNAATCETFMHVATIGPHPAWSRGLCEDTLRLFAGTPGNPPGNYLFAWSGPNGFTSNEENPVIPAADTADSGIYTVLITGETGCTAGNSVAVVIGTFNAPFITAEDDTLCAGDPIHLVSTAYSGDVLYAWYWQRMQGDSLLGVTEEPFIIIPDIGPGHYAFFAEALQDTCLSGAGAAIDIFIAPVPESAIGALPAILCVTDTLFLAPATLVDSLTYAWAGPGGYSANEPFPPGIPATSIDSFGLFTLVTSSALCGGRPDSLLTAIQPVPAAPSLTGDTLACEGGQFTLMASGQADSYSWFDPAGNRLDDDATLTIAPAMLSHSGAWRAMAIVNGCPGDTSAGFVVTIDTGIIIEIIAPLRACENAVITLAVNPQAAGNYAWTGPGGFMSTDPTPSVNAAAGTYTVTLLTPTGCEAIDAHDLDVDVEPLILSLATDADTCVDGMTPIVIHSVSEPPFDASYAYQWQGPGTFMQQDSSILLDDATAGASGLYRLVIANGACTSDTASIELILRDGPAAPVIGGPAAFCDGDTLRFEILNPVPDAQYTWSFADTTVIIGSPGHLEIPGVTAALTGPFTVVVSANGCPSSPGLVLVDVSAALAPATIAGPALVCEGDTLRLSATLPAGATAHWTGPNGFNSPDAEVVIVPFTSAEAGDYFLRYTLDGCTSPVSVPHTVGIQGLITPPGLTADAMSICLDAPEPVTLCIASPSVTPGAGYTVWLNGSFAIAGPSTDTCFLLSGPNLLPGANLLTATASLNGCISDQGAPIELSADVFPDLTADAGLAMTFCPDESFALDGSDPSPGTGMWTSLSQDVTFADPSDPNTLVSGLPPGSYTMQWTLSYASCRAYSTDEVQIGILQPPVTVPDTVEVPFGRTQEFTVTLNDTIGGAAYTLEIVVPPQRGNALHAGNGVFRYSPNVGFVGTDKMTYRICSAECPSECSEAVVIIQVGDEDDCFVPTLFTPNNDGFNDRLVIPCLETDKFPGNKITVFNEWGGLVFSSAPYGNDWDGQADGQPLPVGTYFYIMDFGDGSAPKRTFLVIER